MLLSRTSESILTLTLNRPEVLNSLCAELSLSLIQAFSEASSNQAIRAVVLRGQGRAFCTGQDLAEVRGVEDLGPIVERSYNPLIRAIREIEKPVICGLNGVAAGAGANVALACDVIVAHEKASFIQAFSQVGLIPDSGGTFFLPRLFGMHRATALALFDEKLTADEAHEAGIVWKVFPEDEFEDGLAETARRVASLPTKAVGLTKRGFNQGAVGTLDQQLALEAQLQQEAGRTHDYREGIHAFLEKRKAQFKGS